MSEPSFAAAPAAPRRRFSLSPVWGATLVQILLTVRVFSQQLRHFGQYALAPHYDGIKSDFSLLTWLRQPTADGGLIHGHNYPFGEYLWFTDTTPVLALPLRALLTAVPALQPVALGVYHAAIIALALPLSTWLLARLLRGFGLPALALVMLAVALPWLSPQTWRLLVGHLSLALTPALLLTLLALRALDGASTPRAARRPLLALGAGLFLASWAHFYYLPMLGGLSVAYAALWLRARARAGQPWRSLAGATALALGTAGALTYLSLLVADPWHAARPTGGGYGWIDWKMQFGGWFRAYEYNKVAFVLEPTANYPYEGKQYLGAFALYALLVGALVWVTGRLRGGGHAAWWPPADDATGRFVGRLLLASLPLALMSLGETYDLDGGAYMVHNYGNPLFWLHKVTEQVTHFRAMARFAWPAWWAVNLLAVWWAAYWGRRTADGWRLTGRLVLAALLLVLVSVDTLNATHYYRRHFREQRNPLTDAEALATLQPLLGGQAPTAFQALLPIPFFHVGSEGDHYEYTVDPDERSCTRSYQFSLLTGLPLMSHKATRTRRDQARLLWSLFEPGGPAPKLLALLNAKPVLVYLDSAYYDGSEPYYRDLGTAHADQPQKMAWFADGPAFVQRHHLRLLARVGKVSAYAWYPHGETGVVPAL